MFGAADIEKGLQTFAGVLEERNLRAPAAGLRILRHPEVFHAGVAQADPARTGVIVQGFLRGAPEFLRHWEGAAVAVHATPEDIPAGVPIVNEDDAEYGGRVAAHLLKLGLRRYACLWPSPDFVPERREAFEQSMREGGASGESRFCGFSEEDGFEETVADLLRDLEPGTGLFASNLTSAAVIADLCARLGRAIPEDFGLVAGKNNEVLAHLATPAISAVPENDFEAGRLACRILLDRLKGGPVEARLHRVPIPEVVGRGSTDHFYCPDQRVVRAMGFIRETLPGTVSVPALATTVGLNRTELEKRFRKHLGATPAHMILRMRVEHGRRLLLTSSAGIAEIAHAAGFSDNAHFTRSFRRFHGQSPIEFRARNRLA
ncbi:MAG: helix-turn-helix domain-containing protein [Puniceicoccaceae bacterium]